MADPASVALKHLERLLSREPMLRDVISEALPSLGSDGRFVPSVDVYERADRHVVLVDLPGVAREDVRVRLEGAKLVVEGERRASPPADARPRTLERGVGKFRRDFLLPVDVDGDGVTARLEEGVLHVEVPRTHAKGRVVDVEVG